jgi:hypothetical protein
MIDKLGLILRCVFVAAIITVILRIIIAIAERG